jgi:hypothetical protein
MWQIDRTPQLGQLEKAVQQVTGSWLSHESR